MEIHKSHIKLRKLENQQPNIYQGNRIKKKRKLINYKQNRVAIKKHTQERDLFLGYAYKTFRGEVL